jgi:hypothetical protein
LLLKRGRRKPLDSRPLLRPLRPKLPAPSRITCTSTATPGKELVAAAEAVVRGPVRKLGAVAVHKAEAVVVHKAEAVVAKKVVVMA